MRKVTRYSFVFLGIVVLCSTISVREASAQGPLGKILNIMEVHNKALDTVQANVTMKKHNSQLDETDTYVGSTSYIPKSSKFAKGKQYMRLDWEKPAVEQVAIIGDDYKLYKKSINQLYVGKVTAARTNSAGAGNALGFMSMSKAQLKANYDVQYIAQENIDGGIPTWHLLLTPKAAASYKTAELWVDGNGMPLQAKVVDRNNDTTTIILSNVRKNQKIDTKIFDIKVNGANVVKA